MGLLLRVQPSGTRTFYLQLGRGKRVRIGQAGTYKLKQAEERARKITLEPDIATKKSGAGLPLLQHPLDRKARQGRAVGQVELVADVAAVALDRLQATL